MRKLLMEKSVLLLAFVLLVPFLWNHYETTTNAAATPAFTQTKVELRGIGEILDLNIKNKVSKSTYSWTTSNKAVATVTSKGIVTSTGNGIAMIKCKITYPTKKTKTLSCKVTVTVPATAIAIKELTLVNNAYQLALGSTVDLDAVITPTESSDLAYWYIDQDNMLSDPTCVSLDSNNQGIVTGVKAGKAVVRVRAVETATLASAEASDIDDAIIIEVVAPTASVKSSDITGSNQITVVFDSPVQQSTVVNTDGTLSSNITISLCTVNKVIADDPGKLTAILSSDLKTLTITSEKSFEGTYGINFSNKIITTSGVALDEYYKQMAFMDTIAPDIINVTYDDSGMVATINFTETIDFANFAVKGATVVNSASSVTTTTLSILSNTGNYIINTDKKSVSINMSNISSADYGKLFCITMTGIKDLSGNAPSSFTLQAYLSVDSTPKPQARLLFISRTGYNTLTATFDRAIQNSIPGYIQISGGSTIYGVVDTTDPKKVNYTMVGADVMFTGVKQVSAGHWNSFNVLSTDISANTMITVNVDFTIETTSPYVAAYEFDATTNILTLTYSEDVNVTTSSGAFTASLTTAADDILNGININYSVVAHTLGKNIVKLKLTINSTKNGYYSFTMIQGFAKDSFMNMSNSKAIVISNSTGTNELPGPYMIAQSTSDLTQITVMFANKLDVASATTPSNYKISGVNVLSAELKNNTSDGGATVILTVQTIDATTDRPITITGVKGYNNSYTAITSYTTSVLLKENLSPTCSDIPIFDSAKKNVVNLTFSEAIQGNLTVSVSQIYASTSIGITNTVTISGNTAYINLGTYPTSGSYLKITIVSNGITDAAGNKAKFNTDTYGVAVTY